ncbi:MAG: cysteine hydrolase [Rhodospirillaceae bacterium]|nr:MAG: cysteine hydrolase [Rhodospirillaceae bacterium]
MRAALLLIDVQKIYTTAGSPLFVEGNDVAIANMNRLIDHAASRSDFIVYVKHVHKKDGSDAGRMFDFTGQPGEISFVEGTADVDLDPRLKLQKGALTITKGRYSAFVGTGLDETFKREKVNRIAVTGFMTNYCCETTARQGHDLDYYVDFIMDATGCPDASAEIRQPLIKSVTGAVLAGGFACVMSTGDYLAK